MRFSVWYAVLSILVSLVAPPNMARAQDGDVLLRAEGTLEAGDERLDDGRFYDSYSL